MMRTATALLLSHATALSIPVTPVGPFCPFRSRACADNGPLGQAMDGLTEKMPAMATEMAKLQLSFTTGTPPDVEHVRKVADSLIEAEGEWQTLMARMRLTEDFQSREYFKMTAAWAERQGESLETIGLMMRWQADNMRAFAEGRMPLPPPPGVDLEKLAKQQQEAMAGGGAGGGAGGAGGGPMGMMGQVGAALQVDCTPFTGGEAAFESDVVREEYEALCRDHDGIIRLGEAYGGFDARGKLAYIDALEAVEGRWDTFFARFALLGALNPQFKQQTDAFLESMGMDAQTFRETLKEAHELMRADAEAEP